MGRREAGRASTSLYGSATGHVEYASCPGWREVATGRDKGTSCAIISNTETADINFT